MQDQQFNYLDIGELRILLRKNAEARRASEARLQESVIKAAKTKAEFKRQYAVALVSERAKGTSVEVAKAEAERACADAMEEADIADGMVRVIREHLVTLEGERSGLKTLGEWSMRADGGIGG